MAEATYDTLQSFIKHLLRRFCVHWVPFSERAGVRYVLSQFPSIDKNGIFPLYCAHTIPKDLPIMLVHSKRDKVVPCLSSRRLYMKLRESGHKHVYLLELTSGQHGKSLRGEDGDYYYYVVHAFYQRYGIPCDQTAARKGEPFLESCQPDIAEVNKRIKRSKKSQYRSEGLLDIDDDINQIEDY